MLHKTSHHKVIWMGFLILFIASQPASVSAETNTWTSNGPEGGSIYTLVVDPNMSAILFAGTWGGGVYKSTDGGKKWRLAGKGLEFAMIGDLVIDPRDPTTLYATAGGDVYVIRKLK